MSEHEDEVVQPGNSPWPVELIPYKACETAPGEWGLKCGDIHVTLPAPLGHAEARRLAASLNQAARHRYLPDDDAEWGRWWDIQYDVCRQVEETIQARSKDSGEAFAAAMCAAVIEHVAEMQRRYLHLRTRESS